MEQGMWQKRLSRRAMIGGIAGSAAAAILAACGGSKATDTPKPAGTTAATTAGNTASSTTAASSAVATRPAGSTVAGTAAPATGATGTTAAASTTAGTTTSVAAYSPQGTKAPNASDKQTYRLAALADPKTLDPATAQYADSISFIHLMYDDLYSYDDKGTLIPRAAVEVPTTQNGGISSDGKTYTVKIRPGQKFSDGSPVTAKDYVYATKRFLDPSLASNYASFMDNLVGYDDLTAKGNEKKTKAELQPLFDKLGVVAKDDNTLAFTLKDVQPTFPFVLSLWGLIPLKQDVVEKGGANWWQDPKNHITNGAWTLETFQSKQKLTFVPNASYTGQKPILTRLEFTIIADSAQRFNAYQNNEIDSLAVPTGNRQQVLADPQYKSQIVRGPQLTTFGFRFQNQRAPFNNPVVRKAFATAIDRDAFINDVFKGIGKPITSWIAPGEPGYNESIGSQYKFDAAKAKKILSDAGIDPKSLNGTKYIFSNTGDNPSVAQAIQAQLRQNLGVDIALDPQESTVYQQLVSDKHDYQFNLGGWGADYPDPENWLIELFGTKGGNNDQLYSNPKVDALFQQAKVELDNTKRLALLDQAHKIIVDDDAGVAPLYVRETFSIKKPTVIGLVPNPMDGNAIGDQHAFRGIQITK
ncbi:MAG: peptide ABC transporter substrate-binding protein [Chloroflexota bacterium]|nr:peptide ABC transporter substrate-binding protein [Chloroflexota bacterium]